MNKKTLISTIISVILLVIALFQGKTGVDKDNTIAELQARLLVPKEAPAMVAVADGKVSTVYRDRVVTRYVPNEGKVTFDSARLQQAYALLDSLRRVAAEMEQPKTSVANGDSVASKPVAPSAAIKDITARIDSLRSVIANPEGAGILVIKTWGTCLRPAVGAGWNGDLDCILNAKLLYWNRYGLGVGVTGHQVGVTITRKVNDWVPFLRNTELIGLYGIPFKQESGGAFAGIAIGL